MKRFFALFAATALLGVLLFGCNSATSIDPSEEPESATTTTQAYDTENDNELDDMTEPETTTTTTTTTTTITTTTTTTTTATTPEFVRVNNIHFGSSPSNTIRVGQTHQFRWYINPSHATVRDVEFRSTNERVARITQDGFLTIVGTGTATIIMRSRCPIGSNQTASHTVMISQ